jgi:hypothetical protein
MGVARKLANSGRAAKQLTKAALEVSLPLDASVFSIVASLEGHDLNGLRVNGVLIWGGSRLLICSVGC